MKIFKFALLLFVSMLLINCSTTKFVYKTKSNEELKTIGIANLNRQKNILDSIYSKIDSCFSTASIKYANRFLSQKTIYLDETISAHNPDSLKIVEVCSQNNLDGIILTFVRFKNIISTVYFIPVNKYYQCELYTKIYHKNGKLLYSVVHDSKEDSVELIHTPYQVLDLAIGITYKKINAARKASD